MENQKVLIIDDHEEILQLLEIELNSEGLDIIKANSGAEAIMKAKEFNPDLIITDLLLPDMNGAQIIQRLKSENKIQDIPVIFLTAILTKEEADLETLGVKVEHENYLTLAKPFEHEELIKAINKVLHRSHKG